VELSMTSADLELAALPIWKSEATTSCKIAPHEMLIVDTKMHSRTAQEGQRKC
jgi:hypothetical protein